MTDPVNYSYKGQSLQDTLLDLAVRFILNCPQEDLSSSNRFMFQVEEAHWYYLDFAREENRKLPQLSIYQFVNALYSAVPLLSTICEDWEQALIEFRKYKKGIPVRGGIMLNDAMTKVVLVMDWNHNGWSFPRGKINKEEDDMACAIREVYEETGFDMGPYIQSPKDYIELNNGNQNLRFYVATGVPKNTKFVTRTRKEISAIRWFYITQISPKLKTKGDGKKFVNTTRATDLFYTLLKGFIAAKRAVAKSSTKSMEEDLKSVLGVGGPKAAEVVMPLMPLPPMPFQYQMFGYPQFPFPLPNAAHSQQKPASDDEVLQQLIQEGQPLEEATDIQLDSKKQILALLKKEFHNENANDSSHLEVDTSESPALPPNSILESLVTSRRENPHKRRSAMPTRKPVLPQTALLQVLNSKGTKVKQRAKLTDLLNDPNEVKTVERPAVKKEKRSLMDLLGESEVIESNEHKKEEIQQVKKEKKKSLMDLLDVDEPVAEKKNGEITKGSKKEKDSKQPISSKPAKKSKAPERKKTLMDLLPEESLDQLKIQPESETQPVPEPVREPVPQRVRTPEQKPEPVPVPEPVTTTHVPPVTPEQNESAELMSLLRPKPIEKSQEQKKSESIPKKKRNGLLGLLEPEEKPTNNSTHALTANKQESASLMDLLTNNKKEDKLVSDAPKQVKESVKRQKPSLLSMLEPSEPEVEKPQPKKASLLQLLGQ